jgi:hypothetical protein
MKQLNFNQLIIDLALHKAEAFETLRSLDPIELAALYGTILNQLKDSNLDVQLPAAKAAAYIAPHLKEKYQKETLHKALLLKLSYQVAPVLSPAMQTKEAIVRTEAINALGALELVMDDTQRATTFDRLTSFISRKDVNIKRDSNAMKSAIDAIGLLVPKLAQPQKKLLLTILEPIDRSARLEKPALESTHRVLGMLKPSFEHIHFALHLGHLHLGEDAEVGTEREQLLKRGN